jgi:octaprenyl-diphosphate synthase
MLSVKEIKAPVQKEMDIFEEKFKDAMLSSVPMLDKVTHYIVKRKGKQMRPLFVFLVAKMLGEINESTFTSASLIEMLHTATLVHDDVVDDANDRRGFFSVNALWKNKIAVLVGDYLLSKGLLLSIDNGEFDVLRVVSNSVREMSEGELLQIEKARKLDITEEVYFEVIRKKTATLISSCCECGAVSVGKMEERENIRKFGELIGLAFQIKDDIFDYGDGEKIGKPTGLDIRERKMTIPIIYALNNSTPEIKSSLINIVKNHNEEPKMVKKAINMVIKAGGVQYAHKKMIDLKNEALSLLDKYPESESKNALIGLVEYTTMREK